MPDLESHFRRIREAGSPDLWDEIVRREPRPTDVADRLTPHRKLGIILLALVVAAFGIGFVVYAFRAGPPKSPPASTGPVPPPSNGGIYYVVADEGPYSLKFKSVDPEGTDQHVALVSTNDAHFHELSFSPDGERMAFADASQDSSGIATAAADGSGVRHLTDGRNDSWPSWSPDGSKIAFSGTEFDPNASKCALRVDYDCPTDIYVMNSDGSDLTRLATSPGPDFQPVWSPDGTQIAFVAVPRTGSADTLIWVMNADGSGARPVSSDVGGYETWPAWSPDGSLIVFAAVRNRRDAVYGVAPDGSGVHAITAGNGVDTPAWSPDGSLIAYTAVDPKTGVLSLYTMRPDGSDATLVATDRPPGIAADIAWRPAPETPAPSAAP
jgi:Tol biopolymer transport system component